MASSSVKITQPQEPVPTISVADTIHDEFSVVEETLPVDHTTNASLDTTVAMIPLRTLPPATQCTRAVSCPHCLARAYRNEPVHDVHIDQTRRRRITNWMWVKGAVVWTSLWSFYQAVLQTLQYRQQASQSPSPDNSWQSEDDLRKACNKLKEKGVDLTEACQKKLAMGRDSLPNGPSVKEKRDALRDSPARQSFTQYYSTYISEQYMKLKGTIDEAKRNFLREIGGVDLQDFAKNPQKYVGGGAALRRTW